MQIARLEHVGKVAIGPHTPQGVVMLDDGGADLATVLRHDARAALASQRPAAASTIPIAGCTCFNDSSICDYQRQFRMGQ
jgi:hypothetical protein